ncbi:MAG: RecQ family ATP-dependent DNA helicase [Verrucomicrobiales bacterium]|nr:RecQ family ATP-dependent DNA helicase [Verrucomicrobiales bacterium]
MLKKYFGFTSFRPLQEEIIRDAMAGQDVFALLPTGGGKSLCFQLPALARPGLTVVVSPLIALMKDQVDALQAAGVPATFLNSSLGSGESGSRLRALRTGEFRLLYVAPERLMLPGFLEDLERWNVNLCAVDEAHCISEWGHDFRPEYRQLAALREKFPKIPMMALTATATKRVRSDIIQQLHLRNPANYVASFNRPNLTYRVSAKSGAYEQILSFIRARRHESGIIYCQARKTAESLAVNLNGDGIRAAPYHAGMEARDRSQNQEAFLRDEVRVICATIAFGMGINKPNVRFVIHYDLPKNIEGYYQETGRAGRDGLPSECLLLFSPGDRIKYGQFIDEKPDPKEREMARAQLEQIIHYAECATCRRAFLLNYFGETFPPVRAGVLTTGGSSSELSLATERENELAAPPHESSRGQERRLTAALSSTEDEREKLACGGGSVVAMRAKNSESSYPVPLPIGWGEDGLRPGEEQVRSSGLSESQTPDIRTSAETNCGACDNCLSPRETWDGTIAAQKLLSCVYRIKEKSGFGVGINHVVEVLSGADTDKVRKWGHNTISTYGIGAEHSRAAWAAIARELVRLGYLRQNADKFQILELTPEGVATLKTRRKVMLTRPVSAPEPAKHRAGEIACDEALFAILRQLRKQLADERGVPPYIIFSDVALRQMACDYPGNEAEFARISGVGEKKLHEFGKVFMDAIGRHLQSNARQIFADDSFVVPNEARRSALTLTVLDSLNQLRAGRSVEEIARSRSLVPNTIYGHLAAAIEAGERVDVNQILTAEAQREIEAAFARHGLANLGGAVESLGGRYSYGQLRVYRAVAQKAQR